MLYDTMFSCWQLVEAAKQPETEPLGQVASASNSWETILWILLLDCVPWLVLGATIIIINTGIINIIVLVAAVILLFSGII